MALIDTDTLQPFYDNYLQASEHWGKVSKPGLESFLTGDLDALETNQDAILQARAACFYAANDLAECLRSKIACIEAQHEST